MRLPWLMLTVVVGCSVPGSFVLDIDATGQPDAAGVDATRFDAGSNDGFSPDSTVVDTAAMDSPGDEATWDTDPDSGTDSPTDTAIATDAAPNHDVQNALDVAVFTEVGVDAAAVDTGVDVVPVCTGGLTRCGGVCRDLTSDTASCGTCGHACGAGAICSRGACMDACSGGCSVAQSCPGFTTGTPVDRATGCGFVAIPGGAFTMGGDAAAISDNPSQPVTVSSFTLDAFDVTVARFRRFWMAGHPAATSPLTYPGGTVTWTTGGVTAPALADGYCTWSETAGALEAHPINCVDWYTAQAFCVWDGGRLPTEAEWEYAARGTSGAGLLPERFFAWGNTAPSGTCDLAEWNSCPGDDGTHTKRVGSLAPTGGLYDMEGNVSAWLADWYAAYSGDAICWGGSMRMNPVCGHNATGSRAVRGGSWYVASVASLRAASRDFGAPVVRGSSLGFRCARTP